MNDRGADQPDQPDQPDPSDLLGRIVGGRYRIMGLLGEGAMGRVYMAEHLRIGRRDAIKVLRSSLARDPEAVRRFTRGARNASAIRHPNVCTVYDFFDTSDGVPLLAMELVEGEVLTDRLEREGRLAPGDAARIGVQVAAALAAAHELGIVHRDLKPDNIMLARGRDGREEVKVVDFDIAKTPGPAGAGVTRLGFLVGTPRYMSPEQLTGDPIDGRSDLYSLGLILFRMLTGQLPFEDGPVQKIVADRLTTTPRRLTEVLPDERFPPELQALLDASLSPIPDDRPESAGAFAAALQRSVLGGAAPVDLPTEVSAREPAPVTSPWPRRMVGVGLAGILVAACFAVIRLGPAPWDGLRMPPLLPVQASDTSDGNGEEEEGVDDPVPAAVEEDVARGPLVTPDPDPSIAAEEAHARVLNELFRLTDDPSAAEAVRESVQSVWARRSLPDSVRAFAAYVYAQATIEYPSDLDEAVLWARRATRLDPGRSEYSRYLADLQRNR